MTETTLRLALDELSTARICCVKNGCKGKVEVPTDKLQSLAKNLACPVCGAAFSQGYGDENPFAKLGDAIRSIVCMKEYMQIEFSVPVRN